MRPEVTYTEQIPEVSHYLYCGMIKTSYRLNPTDPLPLPKCLPRQ
jgi:hypothetical protein